MLAFKMTLKFSLYCQTEYLRDDEGGVGRDGLSEFWSDFYNQSTTGMSFEVPFLRHAFEQ